MKDTIVLLSRHKLLSILCQPTTCSVFAANFSTAKSANKKVALKKAATSRFCCLFTASHFSLFSQQVTFLFFHSKPLLSFPEQACSFFLVIQSKPAHCFHLFTACSLLFHHFEMTTKSIFPSTLLSFYLCLSALPAHQRKTLSRQTQGQCK